MEEGILGLGSLMVIGVKEEAGCGIEERIILLDSDRGMGEGIGEDPVSEAVTKLDNTESVDQQIGIYSLHEIRKVHYVHYSST